jgi:hypothetical protein
LIVLAAVVALESRAAQPLFALAGIGVQIAGLVLLFRCHAGVPGGRR